ncbi:unnamed protein product [Ectocarpus sp. CCAP 1310/34]|nr:unnamed protein product [Ectocarpus sp. CCAP 1310/34]
MKWRASLGVEPEWKGIRCGVTPEKKKQLRRSRQTGQPTPNSSQALCCRLVCLTLHPEFKDDYMCFRGGGEGTARTELDVRATGAKHRFFARVARAMATPTWRDGNGNPLSVPNDHSKDELASEHLKSLLKRLDLEGAAKSLQEELRGKFKGDEGAFYADLQLRCFNWLKEVRGKHTKFKENEQRSGGAGADATQDGGFVNARHPFQFMRGSLPTMLWEDGIELSGGGDDETYRPGDIVLPDGHPGSGSSVPGGPGVRGRGEATPARSSGNTNSRKHKKPKTGSDDRAELVADTKEVIALWRKAAEQEVRGDKPAFGDIEKDRAKDLAMEGFIDDVQRLQAKVDSASSDFLREKYQKLLDAAEARVARAEQSSDEAAMASSSAAAAPPPLSSPAAPSTPAAVEGGTVHVM